jgi:hypothetical protein
MQSTSRITMIDGLIFITVTVPEEFEVKKKTLHGLRVDNISGSNSNGRFHKK